MQRYLGSTALAIVLLSQAGWADGFYIGGGVGAGSFATDPSGGSGSGVVGNAVAGFSSSMGGQGSFGLELGVDQGSFSGASATTFRLRGIAGMQLGTTQPFLSLGLARQTGDLADSYGGGNGFSFGLGVQIPMQGNSKLRIEVLRDVFDADGKVSGWSNDTVRANFLFGF